MAEKKDNGKDKACRKVQKPLELSRAPQWASLLEEIADPTCPTKWEAFPPRACDRARLFSVGQPVWVLMGGKPFARGTVVAVPSDESDSTLAEEFGDRYRIKYQDGSHYHCRPGRLCPLYASNSVVVTAETKHYRQLARLQPNLGDRALEIGSDLGACTKVLDESVSGPTGASSATDEVPVLGSAVGLDKSSSSVEEARRRYPDVPFHCLDILTAPCPSTLQELASGSTFDLVFIDINGNRMIEAVAEAIIVVRKSLPVPPRLIVVKSSAMARELEAALALPHAPDQILSGLGD